MSKLRAHISRPLAPLMGVILALAILFVFLSQPTLREYYERASVTFFPNAERAYLFGQRHFNATHPDVYDVDLAEFFFWKARSLDSNHPYVYHELARIAFLKGDFDSALGLISLQINKHGSVTPSSHYIRGLILGYKGDYDKSAENYEAYLHYDGYNWAALNDYAWVLLMANRPAVAHTVLTESLAYFPDNAWLLNSHAVALYEMGEYEAALISAKAAAKAAEMVTEAQWLMAYPGNDPKVAIHGMEALRTAIEGNIHRAEAALANNTLQ